MTLPDASEVKFVFGTNYSGQELVRGMFTHLPEFDNLHITADQSVPRDLALWAAGTGPPTTKAIYRQSRCEYFIKTRS